tara:strand:- start:16 stop:1008 length:993 start_codon:yes stop_codon:yes gene_type:complete
LTIQPSVLAVVAAVGLDWLIGDPLWLPHPVVVMGWWIQTLRARLESWAGERPPQLHLAGLLITLILISGTALSGWFVERLTQQAPHLGWPLLVIALASALAGRSLRQSVMAVLKALPPNAANELTSARERLSRIVGRDVHQLDAAGIIRACAETASENAVDGIFAPLAWMAAGCFLWSLNSAAPGPLALAWAFKASSTLDSMLGYREGRLRWLGTAGARLDDVLTWLPCRLVMATLPLVSRPWWQWWSLVLAAERDGASDPSPNAGRSEAIYAHCTGVRLGGRNRYSRGWIEKPVLAADQLPATKTSVGRILQLNLYLQGLWMLILLVLG